MELTLSSALSPAGMLGHLAYVFLVGSMLMRDITLLRILVTVSGILAIVYASVFLHDPVSTFWETMLVTVNVVQLGLLHWRNLRARFTPAEAAFVSASLPALSRGEARKLLDLGRWVRLEDGVTLTRQGVAVPCLTYLAEGGVDVLVNDRCVARCRPGDFIGEMTVLAAQPATATTRVAGQALVWRIDADRLRALTARNDRLGTAVEAAFARNFRDKLIHANTLLSRGALP